MQVCRQPWDGEASLARLSLQLVEYLSLRGAHTGAVVFVCLGPRSTSTHAPSNPSRWALHLTFAFPASISGFRAGTKAEEKENMRVRFLHTPARKLLICIVKRCHPSLGPSDAWRKSVLGAVLAPT